MGFQLRPRKKKKKKSILQGHTINSLLGAGSFLSTEAHFVFQKSALSLSISAITPGTSFLS